MSEIDNVAEPARKRKGFGSLIDVISIREASLYYVHFSGRSPLISGQTIQSASILLAAAVKKRATVIVIEALPEPFLCHECWLILEMVR